MFKIRRKYNLQTATYVGNFHAIFNTFSYPKLIYEERTKKQFKMTEESECYWVIICSLLQRKVLSYSYQYSTGYFILNIGFDHPLKQRLTWHSSDNITQNIIDFCILVSWITKFVTNVRLYNIYVEFDRRQPVAKLITPATK